MALFAAFVRGLPLSNPSSSEPKEPNGLFIPQYYHNSILASSLHRLFEGRGIRIFNIRSCWKTPSNPCHSELFAQNPKLFREVHCRRLPFHRRICRQNYFPNLCLLCPACPLRDPI